MYTYIVQTNQTEIKKIMYVYIYINRNVCVCVCVCVCAHTQSAALSAGGQNCEPSKIMVYHSSCDVITATIRTQHKNC
jgi:hypothetical protein